jgi:CBS domain-containing protein
MMTVQEVMTRRPATCRQETNLAAVATLMWDHDCGFVPVVGPSGTVVGVITDRDICIATATRRLLTEHISAAQTMTHPIRACLPTDAIGDVLAAMKKSRIRRLVVIDGDGLLQGVISMNDIVLASGRTGAPSAKDIVSALAAICAHRTLAPVEET